MGVVSVAQPRLRRVVGELGYRDVIAGLMWESRLFSALHFAEDALQGVDDLGGGHAAGADFDRVPTRVVSQLISEFKMPANRNRREH